MGCVAALAGRAALLTIERAVRVGALGWQMPVLPPVRIMAGAILDVFPVCALQEWPMR